MVDKARASRWSASGAVTIAVSAALLSGCATSEPPKVAQSTKRSKEYFAESKYGVKASPRVAYGYGSFKRGGGRDQLGKPYMVRGKMYYPKEEKHYRKTGLASWYGDAFHGRLTANGEVYDMTHLTAAHPTMPLPSYARVTNTANGSSVIVRVNDRGPYHNDRLIDLSKRAAELLDYTHTGTAKVKVEYIGRAPLEGSDDSYLLASYRPGKGVDPSVGLPSGVMIAMNGATPSRVVGRVPPASLPGVGASDELIGATGRGFVEGMPIDDEALPSLGPAPAERPELALPANSPFGMASLSYAGESSSALTAFAPLAGGSQAQGWKHAAPDMEYVAAGSFASRADADGLAKALAGLGRVSVEKSNVDGADWYSVELRADGGRSLDEVLRGAWAAGAGDAIVVHD